MSIAWSLLGGLVMLTAGGEMLVRGAAALSLRVGLTPLIVGLTVVAFGTSSPELAVSVDAALKDLGDVAVGNVVGSNICNVALILGLAAVIRPIRVHAQLIRLDMPLMIFASGLLVVLLADGRLGRVAGALCVGALLVWVAAGIRLARRESSQVKEEFALGIAAPGASGWVYVILVLAGLTALLAGGTLFVDGAVSLARALDVSDAVIGLTIVAVGTSLPELAASVVAAARGQGDIATGNIVGSNLFNILGILGVAALVRPMELHDVGWTDLAVMVGVALVLLPMAHSGRTLTRWKGSLLLAIYAGYTSWLFLAAWR